MKKFIDLLTGYFLFGFIIIVIGIFIWASASENSQESDNKSGASTPTQATTQTTTPSAAYTSANVAKHASKSDCWTSYNGKVYDITKYFGSHPAGNSTLLEMCGVDSSSIFNSSHYHSSFATSLFLDYHIGDLAN